MSDEDNHNNKTMSRTKESDIPTETSPGEAYVIFIEMNTLSNKLKLLNYEDEYLLRWKMKPLSKLFLFQTKFCIYFFQFSLYFRMTGIILQSELIQANNFTVS